MSDRNGRATTDDLATLREALDTLTAAPLSTSLAWSRRCQAKKADALAALAHIEADLARLEGVAAAARAALQAIVDHRPKQHDFDERINDHTPEKCAECKRWHDMKHPLQHACDEWGRLFRERDRRNEDEVRAQGYALQRIASDALDELRALDATPVDPGEKR